VIGRTRERDWRYHNTMFYRRDNLHCDNLSKVSHHGINCAADAAVRVGGRGVRHLLIGFLAPFAGLGLVVLGSPKRWNGAPGLSGSQAARMSYLIVILVFFSVGVGELIAWMVAGR